MPFHPLVSIIIPCYNSENFIAETLESAFSQSYMNIEVLVVDDGSTDNSRKILEKYSDRLTLLEHPGRMNKGPAAAFNLALRYCQGEYIAILDSDDLFYPSKIEKQVAYLKSHFGMGIVFSNGMNINKDGEEIYPLYPEGERPIVGPELELECCAFNLPCNALVRKSIYDEAGFFNEAYRTAYDHDMAIRLAEIAPAGYVNEILWCYRRHSASISHTRTMERWKNGFKILDAAVKRYPYPFKTRFRRKAVLHFRLGQCYLHRKELLKGAYHFLLACAYDPVRSVGVVLGKEKVSGPQ